jgi:tetratricopeptide (TPR) repeat protein
VPRHTLGRTARWITLALLAVIAVIWVRVATSARHEFEHGQAAEAAGAMPDALRHYQYALRWYSPFATAPQAAADALWRIAEAADTQGDRATALAALRRLRGGIRATRWLLSPFDAYADPVDDRLAEHTADEQLAQGNAETIRGRSRAQLVADHRALLALDPMPATGWSLLVVLSFLGWVGSALLAISQGLTKEVRIIPAPLLRWSASALLCFALWVLGLINA